jgi:hypothetical protein
MATKDMTVQAAGDSYTLAANKAAVAHEAAVQSGHFAYQTAARNVGQAYEYAVDTGNRTAEKVAATRDNVAQYATKAKETLVGTVNDAPTSTGQQKKGTDLSAQSNQSMRQTGNAATMRSKEGEN